MAKATAAATTMSTASVGDPRPIGSPSVEVGGARDHGMGVFLGDDDVVPGGRRPGGVEDVEGGT